MAHGPFSIGPALSIHLQNTEIDAQLDFLLPILADKLSYHHLPWPIFPSVQQMRDIEVHCGNMTPRLEQVNALPDPQFHGKNCGKNAVVRTKNLERGGS